MVGGVVSIDTDQCVFVSSLLLPSVEDRKSLALFTTVLLLSYQAHKKNRAEIDYHRLNTRKPQSKISSFPIEIVALSCSSQQLEVSVTPG